jgi:hypothetical protein
VTPRLGGSLALPSPGRTSKFGQSRNRRSIT